MRKRAHRISSHTRLTMEPFPEKPIDKVASTSICVRTELEANGGVSGVRHTNSMQFVTVEKLQKSPKSRNCRNHQVEKLHKSMQCFNLGARMRRG